MSKACVRADLADVDLVEPGPHVGAYRLGVLCDVVAAGAGVGDHLGGDWLAGLFEVRRGGQGLAELAGQQSVGQSRSTRLTAFGPNADTSTGMGRSGAV